MRDRAVLATLLSFTLATLTVSCSLDRKPSGGGARTHGAPISSELADAGAGAGGAAGDHGDGFGNPGQAGAGGAIAGTGAAGAAGTDCSAGAGCGPVGTSGLLPSGMCEPTGIFGTRVTVDVAWGGRNTPLGYITDNGRGRITVDLKTTIEQVNPDGTFTATTVPCNTALPPFFSSILCEVYQPIFPNPLWDSANMRVLTTTGRYECTAPGCVVHMDPATGLIGIDLTDPNAVWPTAAQTKSVGCPGGSGTSCFLDHDGDQKPGITINFVLTGANPANQVCTSGYTFRPPPLSGDPFLVASGAAPRALLLHLGTRVRVAGQGALSPTCGQRVGRGAAYGFDSRAISCVTHLGAACTDAEQAFMDENLPVYAVLGEQQVPPAALDLPDKSPSTGTTFSMTRLGNVGDTVSCADVRAAQY